MASMGNSTLVHWLRRIIGPRVKVPPEVQRAKDVIAAVDAGGLPLNPARINQIARDLGLEVARNAPLEETLHRLRAAVSRL